MSDLRFGLPPGPAAWAALALAVLVALGLPRLLASPRGRRAAPMTAALFAAALSWAYVLVFLRGGPRIVDATTYLLQARALAGGQLAWAIQEPASSEVGRFLVRDVLGEGTHAAGLFPPGWPAVLALGVLAGAPLAVGPVLAALLALATAWLAREVVASLGEPLARAPWLPWVPPTAAALSAVCACLRYHTADTMSHGLAALLATVALAASLRARRSPHVGSALVVGASLGWLSATRPVTALAATSLVLIVALSRGPGRLAGRALAARVGLALLAALPGLTLLLLHQRAATGSAFASSQSLYYALSDGPAGCFRWGFGGGVGCEHEHGAFVAANLPEGYGAYAAAATTLRRWKAHLVDPLSFEPLFALVIAGAFVVRREARARVVALAPVALSLAYLPFYFDGNYPGGGARFLADGLPVEHVLASFGGLALAAHLRPAWPAVRVAALLVAASLAGFAVRGSWDHGLLRDREGGLPMFDAPLARALGAGPGIVFVDTDHGFAIGHDPRERAPEGMEVLRLRGDALDHLAWEARGRPPAWRWSLGPLADDRRATPTLTPFEPPASDRVEAEGLWPPTLQRGAFAAPRWASGTCASSGRWLGLVLTEAEGVVELELPRALRGAAVEPRVAREAGIELALSVVGEEDSPPPLAPPASGEPWACQTLAPLRPLRAVGLGEGLSSPPLRVRVVMRRRGEVPVGADRRPAAALDLFTFRED